MNHLDTILKRIEELKTGRAVHIPDRIVVDRKDWLALKADLEKAVRALAKYAPYCVIQTVPAKDPAFEEFSEVWLAKQTLKEIAGRG